MSRYFLILSVLFSATETELRGQGLSPILTDRPDQTETPFTVPKNRFQMETGFLLEQTNSETKSFLHPSILFKFGLSNNFELGLITEFATIRTNSDNVSGLSPVTLRFKENIAQEHGLIPATSFIGYLSVPYFASKNFQATYFAPAFRFTLQHTLSPRLSLGYNLGAQWDGETAEPTFIYTLTTGYSITNKIGTFVELYGFAPQKSKADHRVDGGFNYLVCENMLFDISAGLGISNNVPEYFLGTGFSFRLKD